MRSFALLLLAAPLAAAPLVSLDHGACVCDPDRAELVAAPTDPAGAAPFDADAYLRALAREVEWIAARNDWRRRRVETREQAHQQEGLEGGAGLFGLAGPALADAGASPAALTPAASTPAASSWFQFLPVDPATPGYAYTGAGGQRVGWRVHPVHGGRRFHTGIDLGVDQGTPIHAIGDARVIRAGQGGGFGHWLILEHAGGVRSFNAHMAEPAKVRSGRVVAGQVIGYVGSTGTSTAPHLHFEVWGPRGDLPAYAREWISQGAYSLDESHMPGLGLIDPARLADFARRGGTPSGEGAPATPAPQPSAD